MNAWPPDGRALGLIVGLGNVLRQDDGAGVHALRELVASPPVGWDLLEIGVAPLDAIGELEGRRVVIAIDAVECGGAPGALYVVRPRGLTDGVSRDAHALDLRAVTQMIAEENRPMLMIVGVEPQSTEWGEELTPAVQDAMPALLSHVRRLAAEILSEVSPRGGDDVRPEEPRDRGGEQG